MTGVGTTSARGGGDTQLWHRPSIPASTIGPWLPEGALGASLADGLVRVESALTAAVGSEHPFVREAAGHLMSAGGKRFRPMLALLAAQLGDPSAPEVTRAAVVCELTHLATLYHDDVMDEADVRRGAPSANSRWTNSIAILTGDLLFARASDILADLGPEAVRIQARTFERLVTGQIRETVGPAPGQDPVAHHLTVLNEKTASLIDTCARYGGMFSGAPDADVAALRRYGRALGVAFQVSDDIIDIASADSGKTPGTDLREGVRTLPVLYTLADPDADPELVGLLAGPIEDDAAVQRAVRWLRSSPGVARARSTLDEYAGRARDELDRIAPSSARDALAAMTQFVVERTR
jgi:heptaprenyl diphosphate synthase